MANLNYVLIDESQRFKLMASFLEMEKLRNTLVLFGTEAQVEFFQAILANTCPKLNTNLALIEEADSITHYDTVLLMDVPLKFELVTKIIDSMKENSKLILFLFKSNKDYVKMIKKATGIQLKELTFNANKLLMVEDKYLHVVDSNYAINRLAFYAYGSFLKYFNANLLKRVFRTDRLNMKSVGMGFGMTVPPKVNMDAKFLTQKAQIRQKAQKKRAKMQRLKQKAQTVEKTQVEQQASVQVPVEPKTSPKKTKKIRKSKV